MQLGTIQAKVMKYRIPIIFLFFLIYIVGYNQSISIGAHDGISYNGISGSFDFKNFRKTETHYRFSHEFGVLVNVKLKKFFHIQIEVNYCQNGFNFNNPSGLMGVSYSGFYKFKYIELPILSLFEFGRSIKYFGFAGIDIKRLLQSENYTLYSVVLYPESKVYDLSYNPSSICNYYELSSIIGLGISFPLVKNLRLLIDSRFTFGLTRAIRNTNYNYDSNQWTIETPDNFKNVHNQSIALRLGIIYRFNSELKQGQK